ncbi:MAG: alkaline phosphatase, partial [Oxalobacteraceae bacterium]
GDLLDLNLLDTRQFRTQQPCGDAPASDCAGIGSPDADVLGSAQQAWLFNALETSTSRWKVLAQQVMMMDIDRDPGPAYGVAVDSWAGYRIPRARLLSHLQDRGIANAVVLTGDEHKNMAGELHVDGRNPEGAPVATEFVGTSISSSGDGYALSRRNRALLDANPQLKFVNGQRGYVLCDVSHDRWRADFKVMDRISDRNGAMTTCKSLAIETGDPRLHDV